MCKFTETGSQLVVARGSVPQPPCTGLPLPGEEGRRDPIRRSSFAPALLVQSRQAQPALPGSHPAHPHPPTPWS